MLWPLVRRRWYRLLGAGSLVMLLALAPSLLSLDHWSEFLGLATAGTDENTLEHAGHCHIGPATCSEQPLPPDLSATPAVVRVVEPELTSFALEEHEMTAEEHVVAPPTDPPRT